VRKRKVCGDETPRMSVVVCTDGRAASLCQTLHGLSLLDHQAFEICVVLGPTADNARAAWAPWGDRIKVATCPERNLSRARNIGIGLAAGEVVAFIDDDAIPEPEWLDDLAAAYADPAVGGAGGFVYDQTGVDFQARFVTTDRLGAPCHDWQRPASEFNFPLSANFPHLLGTNSSFRRSALVSVGGFDEEYDYFLDETDLCCRLIDGGWSIAQLAGAYVHHKFLPSAVRRGPRLIVSWFSLIKNKIYYALLNGRGHHSMSDILQATTTWIGDLRWQLEHAIAEGKLHEGDRARFRQEVEEAWRIGLARGLEGRRRLMSPERLAAAPPAFRNMTAPAPAGGRKTFCFLSREYPPHKVGGVGRYVHQLATSVAALGHKVHVLTPGEGHARVDLEDAVWVHRILIRDHPPAKAHECGRIPARIWSYCGTMLDEVRRVSEHRPVNGVYAPIWDCEGAAVLRDGAFPLMTGLQTMLRFWLKSNPDRAADPAFAHDFVAPMLSLESEMLAGSQCLHAISEAIVDDIEDLYETSLGTRAFVVPLGLADYRTLPAAPAPAARQGVTVRLLFVGRLESRKGIDILLQAALKVLRRFPKAQLDVVGNDRLPDSAGQTARARFEMDPRTEAVRERVVFHGEVDDDALRGFYEACDIFVAPSRFESFGLIFVEGMIYARPVIGCRAGGMPEVIADGETGLLAEPGDVASLVVCMTQLLEEPALRVRMGRAGRQRYERLYTPERMAREVLAAFAEIESRPARLAGVSS
jgi:glycogen(starch) synthase